MHIDELVAALGAGETWPYTVVRSLVADSPEELPGLLHTAVETLVEGSSPAVDYVVAFVDLEVLETEVEHAVDVLRDGASTESQAARLIEAMALQAPELLTGYEDELDLLLPAIRGDVGPQEAGVLDTGDGLRRLTSESTYHLRFPPGFLTLPGWQGIGPLEPHPTWHVEDVPASVTAAFGGPASTGTCETCEDGLDRLLYLSPVPDGLVVTGHPALEVVTCLSCLGWETEVVFVRHTEEGQPLAPGTRTGAGRVPEFPADPFPAVQVSLVRTLPRWLHQDWALSNGRENLNRVGGEPTWVQSDPDHPSCPDCGQTMAFLLQIDSLDFADRRWLWGNGGVAYAFWCDGCGISATRWQCS